MEKVYKNVPRIEKKFCRSWPAILSDMTNKRRAEAFIQHQISQSRKSKQRTTRTGPARLVVGTKRKKGGNRLNES